MFAREIDRDTQRLFRFRFSLPFRHLTARRVQDLDGHRNDETGVLADRDELVRRNKAALRMVPPHQRLKSHEARVVETDDRLVVELKFVPLDRVSQIGLELQPRHGTNVHALVKDNVILFVILGIIHRDVGVAENVLGLGIL